MKESTLSKIAKKGEALGMPSQPVQYISLKQLRDRGRKLRLNSTFEPDFVKLDEDERSNGSLRLPAQKQLDDAEQKAMAIVEDARKQAEIIKNESFNKGYQEGFKKGEEAGKAKVQEDSNSLKTFFQDAIEELSSLKSSILTDIEPEIIKLLLMLAEKLVLNSFQIHPEAIVNIVKDLIQKVEDEDEIKIIVNPSVLPILAEYQQQFLDIIDSSSHLKIEGDAQISDGGCLIVTDTNILDAQIETRILEAAKTLFSNQI
jgi:flagellar assembly protein FliH